MSELDKIRFRNESARLINFQDRRFKDCVRFNSGSTVEHEMKKAAVCLALQKDGKSFITEARFENGAGRADIIDLDAREAIEIVKSEKEDSIEEKRRKYPVKIRVVKCGN